MHLVAHDRRQVRVEHVARGRTEHHIEHAELDAPVEEQAKLRQEADLHDMAVARQYDDHQHDEHDSEHVDQMERPTPAEHVRHPCADRYPHDGCDGEAGEHPCDEFRAISFRRHIGSVRHGNGHKRTGDECDEDSRDDEHAIVGRERAQHVAEQEDADQRQMRGEAREARRQGRAERRDRCVDKRE